MSLSRYITLMLLATLFCWAAFFIVIYSIDPFETVFLGLILFYLSLFFALIGTLALLGFLIRYVLKKDQFISQQVIVSFRQAILFAVLVTVSLYLQSNKLITWWNLLILILLLGVIEIGFMYALSNKSAGLDERINSQ